MKIKDMPLLPSISGTEKIPTGGFGNYAVSINQLVTRVGTQTYNPSNFGATANGTLQLASGKYSTLAQAQTIYPFCLSLDESLDYLALQKAILQAGDTNSIVQLPAGLMINREVIVEKSVIIQGSGRGNTLYPHSLGNRQVADIIACGDGSICRTVKTRRTYRASAADPTDTPLSSILNIQAPNVVIRDCWIDNKGVNWDVGVFVGTRLHFKSDSYAVTDFIQANIYVDSTGSTAYPALINWRGAAYPSIQFSGCDGLSIRELNAWGAKNAILLLGAKPKDGLISYGKDYKASVSATLASNPTHGTLLNISGVQFVFVDTSTPDYNESNYTGNQLVSIADTAVNTTGNLLDVCISLIEDIDDDITTASIFASGLYHQNNNVLEVFRRSSSTLNPATDKFLNQFTITTSSSAFTLSNGGVPQQIADPAPYYVDATVGLLPDSRGSYGMSDVHICDSQLFSVRPDSLIYTDTRRVDGDHKLEPDTVSATVYVDGLAGNGSRAIQKHAMTNLRIDSRSALFGLRLGRVNNLVITNVIPDGHAVKPASAPENASYLDYRYGWITRYQGITRRTKIISGSSLMQATTWLPLDSGSAVIADGKGGLTLTGLVSANEFVVDKRGTYKGEARSRLISGVQGSATSYYYTSNGLLGSKLQQLDVDNGNGGKDTSIISYQGRVIVRSTFGMIDLKGMADPFDGTLVRVRSDNLTQWRFVSGGLIPSGVQTIGNTSNYVTTLYVKDILNPTEPYSLSQTYINTRDQIL